MTNEEKAKELGDKLINAVGHTVKDRKEIIDIIDEMIEWKEQQMIERATLWLKERNRAQSIGSLTRAMKGGKE